MLILMQAAIEKQWYHSIL